MAFNNKILLAIFVFSSLFLAISCDKGDGGDDPDPNTPPSMIIRNVTDFEDNADKAFAFKVELSKAATNTVTVNFATEDGTATSPEDFIERSGVLEFAPGETVKNIEINVVGEIEIEGDESFEVTLTDIVNATFSGSTATGTIRNDDDNESFIYTTEGYTSPEAYQGMSLVWEEDFLSDISGADWNFETGTGNGGWGNNELQYYTNELTNVFVANGNLVITAREQSTNGSSYSSARLTTENKKSFKFGRIDVRAKMPKGKGIWPAIWMLGENHSQVGWPRCGEIDIMEMLGQTPKKVYGTAHWGDDVSSHTSAGHFTNSPVDCDQEYNVFSIKWEQDKVEFLFNDVQYHQITNTTVGGQNYPFNDPFFFILNVAVGGNWPGSPDGSTVFPQRMFIDYIRVFQ